MKNQTFQFRQHFIKAALLTSISFISAQSFAQNTFPTPSGNVGIGLPSGLPANDLEVHHGTTLDNFGFGSTLYPGVAIHDDFLNISSPPVSPAPYSVFQVWNHSYTTSVSPGNLLFDNPLLIVNSEDCPGCSQVGIGKQPGSGAGSGYSLLDVGGAINADGNVSVAGNLRVGPMQAVGAYSGYRLSVDGDMIAKRCIIEVSDWADYVFDNKYQLRPLNELQAYIAANNHLPDVPSEKEVKANGIEIGVMNATLLRKVEELTLYMIELKKENDALAKKVEALSTK